MEKTLPKIQELYGDINMVQAQNDLNVLLNQEPNKQWVKTHPMTKGLYIPIERIEWLLTRIFIRWYVEVKDVKLIANSIMVVITLHYQDPINNEWLKQDGVGAAPLQTDKDAGATDWTKIKSNSVQIGAPAAETYAVKDAADKIGKLFGKDLNRADNLAYGFIQQISDTEGLDYQIIIDIENAETDEQLSAIYIANIEAVKNRKGFIKLIDERKTKLNGKQS